MEGVLTVQGRPLMVWAAAFAAGIGLCAFGCLPTVFVFGLAALGLAALALGRNPLIFLFGLLLLALCAGALRLSAFQTIPSTDISRWNDRPLPITLTGTVISDPESRRAGRLTLFLRAENVQTARQTAAATGDVSVSLGPEASGGKAPDYGDRVRLEGTLETPAPATNPGGILLARLFGPPRGLQ